MSQLPRASLIICSRNRPAMLNDVVASALTGDALPDELIIVDDSDEPNQRLARLSAGSACDIRYLWTHASGLSRAANDGIAAARHDVLVFTQDDVLVSPTWFGRIVRALVEEGPRGVVTGRVLSARGETAHAFAPSTKSVAETTVYAGRLGEDVLYMQNMAMHRAAWQDAGPFDETMGPGTPFPAAEDNDFGYRLLEAGYRIVYRPDAVVYHRAWRKRSALPRLRWHYGLGRGAFYAKHLGLRDRHMLNRMVRDLTMHALLFARGVYRHPRRAAGEGLLALGMVVGAARWSMARRRPPASPDGTHRDAARPGGHPRKVTSG